MCVQIILIINFFYQLEAPSVFCLIPSRELGCQRRGGLLPLLCEGGGVCLTHLAARGMVAIVPRPTPGVQPHLPLPLDLISERWEE